MLLPRSVSISSTLSTLLSLIVLLLSACRDQHQTSGSAGLESRSRLEAVDTKVLKPFVQKLAPLISHQKLDNLTGKRAATPRLRKASFWLEMARREGLSLEDVLSQANSLNGPQNKNRVTVQTASLIRNNTILQRLGCLDEAGMEKLRRGKAPFITKGPYAGGIASADHIIPRSVAPELDNKLLNFEFMPLTLNQRKSNKVTSRQVALAREWNEKGLLSDEGLEAVVAN